MRSLFPSSNDRANVLMSAGCSTFVSAALILIIPRLGVVLLEILFGLFFIGCALMSRARLRRRMSGKEGLENSTNAKAKWFDRYDVLMILAVIVVQTLAAGLLRKAGWSEGAVGMLLLIMFAVGILLKPSLVEAVARTRKMQPVNTDCGNTASSEVATAQALPEKLNPTHRARPGVTESSAERKETSDVS